MGKPKVVLYLDDKKYIQHCFICRPSGSTVSEDAGIEIYFGQRCTISKSLHCTVSLEVTVKTKMKLLVQH